MPFPIFPLSNPCVGYEATPWVDRGLIAAGIPSQAVPAGHAAMLRLGDSTGRKTPILLSFIGIVLFSVISASCIGQGRLGDGDDGDDRDGLTLW